MKVEKDPTIRLSIIRCIGELSKKNEERAKEVLKQCGIPFFMDILSTHDMKTVNASSYIIQVRITLVVRITRRVLKKIQVGIQKIYIQSLYIFINKLGYL